MLWFLWKLLCFVLKVCYFVGDFFNVADEAAQISLKLVPAFDDSFDHLLMICPMVIQMCFVPCQAMSAWSPIWSFVFPFFPRSFPASFRTSFMSWLNSVVFQNSLPHVSRFADSLSLMLSNSFIFDSMPLLLIWHFFWLFTLSVVFILLLVILIQTSFFPFHEFTAFLLLQVTDQILIQPQVSWI